MNSLSWLLYAADVAAGISGSLTVIVLVALFAAAFRVAMGICVYNNTEDYGDIQAAKPTVLKLFAVVLAVITVGSFVPSKETMYLIAASEIGEQVVNSDDAKRVMGKVETWLDNKLSESARPQQAAPEVESN